MTNIMKILILVFISGTANAQSRWVRSYLDDLNPTAANMITAYDHGYLLTGRHQPNYPRYNYLIKTDINGEVLWNKTLGDGDNGILPGGLGMNGEGSIYFSGSYGVVGAYSDPLIMKLNKCGEKEWCWLFPTEGYHDYGMGLCVTPDGGVAFVLAMTGEDLVADRVCLARFSSAGDFLWKKCYNINDTVAMGNEFAYEVISTPDSGFLLTGYCQYSNPGDSLSYLCPYYIKADYTGEMEWYTVAGFHPFDVPGEGRQTVLSPDSNFYYSAIRHNFWDAGHFNESSPALLKMDLQGNVIDVYDIAPPNTLGTTSSLKFISDTTISAAAVWGAWASGNDMNKNAIIIDTLGNILEQQVLLESNYPAITEVTYDRKLLYFVDDVDESGNFDVFLFKLNQNLESDSVYSQWFNYDSLCPYQITSDTIPIEGCGLIVGMEELKYVENDMTNELTIYPNPAKNKFTIKSEIFSIDETIVEIVDLFGQKIKTINIYFGESEVEVNAQGWSKGLYLIRMQSKAGFVANGKVMVQ